MADNFLVSVRARYEDLLPTLKLVSSDKYCEKSYSGYRIVKKEYNEIKDVYHLSFSTEDRNVYIVPSLIIYYVNEEDSNQKTLPFPTNLKAEEIEPIIMSWLKSIKYSSEPDIDGSCEKGFFLTTEVIREGYFVSFMVQPAWLVYGK